MLFTISVFAICSINAFADNVILKIPNGRLYGRTALTTTNKPYYSFQKIPYASPPIGPLRFQPPQPTKNWRGILDATEIDVMCYQLDSTNSKESEDCLYLNVYTTQLPTNQSNASLPVIVWIHGGRFSNGNTFETSLGPQYLLDEYVIIVTINYRLGVFGFLSTLDAVIPGNYGLKDQLFAIKWVYSNIGYFGGDRERIIVAGQSAGAGSVSFQLLNRQADGLIKGVICESGVAIDIWNNKTAAREIAFIIGGNLNKTLINTNDSVVLREYLMNTRAEDLKRAAQQFASTELNELWRLFGPVIEVEHGHAFITTRMYEDFRDGNFIKVPMIVGFTSEEHVRGALLNPEKYRRLFEKLDDRLELITPPDMRIKDVEQSRKMGQTIRRIYTNRTFTKDFAAGIRFMTDNDYVRAIIRNVELASKHTNIYLYRFNYDGKLGNVNGTIEGIDDSVGHTEELNYIWYMTEYVDNRNITIFPEADILTHKRLIKMWANFAKTLNPTPKPIQLLQNRIWKTSNSAGNENIIYFDIGENLKMKIDPRNEYYQSWKTLYNSLGFDNFDTY